MALGSGARGGSISRCRRRGSKVRAATRPWRRRSSTSCGLPTTAAAALLHLVQQPSPLLHLTRRLCPVAASPMPFDDPATSTYQVDIVTRCLENRIRLYMSRLKSMAPSSARSLVFSSISTYLALSRVAKLKFWFAGALGFLVAGGQFFQCGQFCAVSINPCYFHTGLFVIQEYRS